MVLIYSGMPQDPRIDRLDDKDHLAWVTLVTECSKRRSETLTMDEIEEALCWRPSEDWTPSELARMLSELTASELVGRAEDGAVVVLARGDLWQFEDDDSE